MIAIKAMLPALNSEALPTIAPDIADHANVDLQSSGNKPPAYIEASDWIALPQLPSINWVFHYR